MILVKRFEPVAYISNELAAKTEELSGIGKGIERGDNSVKTFEEVLEMFIFSYTTKSITERVVERRLLQFLHVEAVFL
jgi:hypothetical protein